MVAMPIEWLVPAVSLLSKYIFYSKCEHVADCELVEARLNSTDGRFESFYYDGHGVYLGNVLVDTLLEAASVDVVSATELFYLKAGQLWHRSLDNEDECLSREVSCFSFDRLGKNLFWVNSTGSYSFLGWIDFPFDCKRLEVTDGVIVAQDSENVIRVDSMRIGKFDFIPFALVRNAETDIMQMNYFFALVPLLLIVGYLCCRKFVINASARVEKHQMHEIRLNDGI